MVFKVNVRFGIVIFVPPCCSLVCLNRSLLIHKLKLVQLGQVLLVASCSSEVALHGVVADGLLQASCCVLRLVFAVRFEGVGQSVCGIVGFAQLIGLYRGSLLETLSSLLVRLLHAESVRSLRIQLNRILVFLCLSAEEGEAAAG